MVAMVQALGYIIGATGPFILGWIHDSTGSFILAVVGLIIIALLMIPVQLLAFQTSSNSDLASESIRDR